MIMKKYIKPTAQSVRLYSANMLMGSTLEVKNEEGNGIQRSKQYEFIDDEQDFNGDNLF